MLLKVLRVTILIQAENVVKCIDSAIGMSDSIGDEAVCVFAAQLYSSISFGKSLQNVFNQAITELMPEGIPEETIPKLYSKKNVTPNEIILVQPESWIPIRKYRKYIRFCSRNKLKAVRFCKRKRLLLKILF